MRRQAFLSLVAVMLLIATSCAAHPHEVEHAAQALVSSFLGGGVPSLTSRRDQFTAKDASCQQGLQTAVSQVTAQCPYVVSYASGTMDSTTFLGKFCNDGCSQLTLSAVQPYAQCLDGAPATVYAATLECTKRPQCYTGSTYLALQDARSCLLTLTNISDASSAAKAAVSSICASSNCATKLSAFAVQHQDCFSGGITFTAAEAVSYINFLCSTPAGSSDTCAWNLRYFGMLLSCTQRTTAATCVTSDNMCQWLGGSCFFLNSLADRLCTPCFDGMISYAAKLGVDQLQLAAMRAVACSKPSATSSAYCFSSVNLVTLFSGFPTTSSGVASQCAGDSGKCSLRMLNAYADLTSTGGAVSFKTCAASPSAASAFYSKCQAPYETALRTAEILRRLAAIGCAANANGALCYPLAMAESNDACFTAGSSGQCPSACLTSIPSFVNAAGCCAPLINSYLQVYSPTNTAAYLPPGPQTVTGFNNTVINFAFTANYAAASLDRSQQPLNALAVCSNLTSLWSVFETACPASGSAISRVLNVTLAWANLVKDSATMQKVKVALRSDVANALNLSPDLLRGDSLVENAKLAVKVGTSSSSGTSYLFSIDAGSSSSTAATNYDGLASNNAVPLPETAAVVVSTCPSCLDSTSDPSSPLTATGGGAGSLRVPSQGPALPSSSSTLISAATLFAASLLVLFLV